MPHSVLPSAPGVYVIYNTTNMYKYIGSTVNLIDRKRSHFRDLRRGIHGNSHLQNAWNQCSEASFVFDVLENVEFIDDIKLMKEKLLEVEQQWIDEILPEYNIRKIASSNLGLKASEETKKKLSEMRTGKKLGPWTEEARKNILAARVGKKHTPEQIAKRAASQRGAKRSPETCAKISAALTGKKMSPERRAKHSEIRKGKKQSPESIEKRVAKMRGKSRPPEAIKKAIATKKLKQQSPEYVAKRAAREEEKARIKAEKDAARLANPKPRLPISDATRAKMSASHKGIKKSPEHIAKVAAANRGKKKAPYSEEYKRKMSEATKGKKKTPEHAAKVGAAHKGTHPTEETKAKMKEVKRKEYENESPERRAKRLADLAKGHETMRQRRLEKLASLPIPSSSVTLRDTSEYIALSLWDTIDIAS